MIQTAEFCSPGHPDKFMDILADTLLFHLYQKNPQVHAGIEGIIKDNQIILSGETSEEVTKEMIDKSLEQTLQFTGYSNDPIYPSTIDGFSVQNLIGHQSEDINRGVSLKNATGAGDQGICISGAYNSKNLKYGLGLSPAFYLAKVINRELFNSRDPKKVFPDIKTQISIDDETNIIQSITVSAATSESSIDDWVKTTVSNLILTMGDYAIINADTKWFINYTGAFRKHFSYADCGVVGRKIVCDQTGGYFPVGGGALSGKDFTKVDRTGVLFARNSALTLLQKYNAKEVCIKMGFSIGYPYSTSNVAIIDGEYKNLSPVSVNDMINHLDLLTPKDLSWYQNLAAWGHCGNPVVFDF